MLEKYKLQANSWLSRLFSMKEKWALVYGRETFSADITTTQRSESMNNSIKRYVSYKYDLLRFFRHFRRLVDDRRYKELIADFKASHTTPALSFPVKILKDASKVYTPAVFKWFQVELCKAHDCTSKLFSDIGSMRVYEVNAHGKNFHHTVKFNSLDSTITCSCKKFEFAGILCSHALKVLSTNDVKTIPRQYILKRWRKDIRDQIPKVSCPNSNDDDDLKGKIARRYRDLARLHIELATITVESDEAYEISLNSVQKTLVDVKTSLRTRQKPPEDISVINNNTHEVVIDEFGEHIVKGIKTKEKIVRKEDSIRPKNALEKLVGKKRSKKDVDISPRHQREPQIDQLNVTPQCVDSIRIPASQNQMNEQIPQYALLNGVQIPHDLPFHPQFNSVAFPPRMQFTSPILCPTMQFTPPYQYQQILGGSNVGASYHQGSMMTYQPPLTSDLNRVPSASTTSTEEHNLLNINQDGS
ncbi:protein FAR-RED IMPAIRED RESPONSE 1-like [Euphorbia lathyris]|uniref:protein FAR-RED IMPAIRED RESPONSE 1-like n=1 Tax=Euphorbia lathyris TaxID=212925 RepID=UPI0033138457